MRSAGDGVAVDPGAETLRIATYSWAGRRHVGRVSEDGRSVVPLAVGERARTVGALALVEAMAAGAPMPRPAGPALPLVAVTLEAPIPAPRRNIFCSGVNYRAHASEWAASGLDAAAPRPGQETPDHPVIFSKVPECVVGPGAPIRIPERVSAAIDYEAELAVVIGREGRGIPASRAMEHVWGYTIINDVTARDLQRRHEQWFKGKTLDTFAPLGPAVVHRSLIPDPQALRLRTRVNGQTRQDSTTAKMVFSVAHLISVLSAGLTLEPGDIVATGTPEGVAMGMTPPAWLRPGDVVEVEIEGIGVLRNRIVAPPARGRA